MRLGLLINEIDTRAGQSQTDLPRFSVSQYRGVIPIGESGVRSAKPKSLEKYKVVHAGDLVLNRFNAYKGALGIAPTKGLVSPDYFTARPISGKAAKYLDYFLRSQQAKEEILLSMSGMGAADPNSSAFSRFDIREVLAIDVPIEDLDTQRRIADYLDAETAQIDAMMAKLDEQVALLQERRNAVTKSAFGEWNLSHLGPHAEVVRRGISPVYTDETGMPTVNQKCIRPGGSIDYGQCRFNDRSVKSVSEDLELQAGDVLVNSTGTGTLGRSATVAEVDQETTFDGHITLIRPNGRTLDGNYLGRYLQTMEGWLVQESRGSTNQIELSKNTLLTLPIPLPPFDEQRRIVAELDQKTTRIDAMIVKCEELKALLKERRAALITAVVTGQKEVPNHD